MFRRIRLFVSLNGKNSSPRRLLDAWSPRPRREVELVPSPMPETVHEVAIYLHRFHNLDLFQQGWYQIKITMRWEGNGKEVVGTPARVVQYEAPGLVSDNVVGVWRIDDTDHSFSTQPFHIKYARQDVLLSVMVSFNLAQDKYELPSTSAVLLKFVLMYAPILEQRSEVPTFLDTVPVSVHEFRIPPKALLGLHSYCPVHFDSYHAVLVELCVHVVFMRTGAERLSKKVTSNSCNGDLGYGEFYKRNQDIVDSNLNELVKSLSVSHDILLERLQNFSKTTGQAIDDLSDYDSKICTSKSVASNGTAVMKLEGEVAGEPTSCPKQSNGFVEDGNTTIFQFPSNEELLCTFHLLGNQISFLWNAFLKFHRINRTRILDHLRESWAGDRRVEWSIWMVHSKADIPHRYLKSEADESVLGKVSLTRKLSDDPAQLAITRAELHRKSIAQMNINNHSIQDMHIYGDPLHVPVVLLEQHAVNAPVLSSSCDSSAGSFSLDGLSSMHMALRNHTVPRLSVPGVKKNNRILRIVIFVHGFQGHHLDLRLVRNQWLLIDPTSECLMSKANEEKTSGDFREMGSRLAEEASGFIKKKLDKASRSGGCKDIRLSFVGHSIGNIIIRSALTESTMEPFLKHLYTFVSLSGPHLGYWYSSNSLFNSGLWLVKKIKGAQCIHQLTFSDDQDLQNTFFYKLCKQKTLENFKNIILMSSPQDGYVPYHSARIELCPASSSDTSKKAQVFTEMLNNCLDQIRAPSSGERIFMRCDVNFDVSSQGRSLNALIGRAAHIEFLETDIFARFIMWSYPELFR